MNWEAIGAIAELAGAVAVVGTLFYLGLQIRQATNQARRTEMNATMSQISLFRMALAQDSDLAALYLKGTKHYDQLDSVETLRFDSVMGQRFWNYAQMWDRIRTSTFERSDWEAIEHIVSGILRDDGSSSWWRANSMQFESSFVDEINRLMKRNDRTNR